MKYLFGLITFILMTTAAYWLLNQVSASFERSVASDRAKREAYQKRIDWCESNGGVYFPGLNPHCEFVPK